MYAATAEKKKFSVDGTPLKLSDPVMSTITMLERLVETVVAPVGLDAWISAVATERGHTQAGDWHAAATLLRDGATIDDAIAADETFSVLMGEQVEPRRKFIEDNALLVRELDV